MKDQLSIFFLRFEDALLSVAYHDDSEPLTDVLHALLFFAVKLAM
jgi:hypothetical protein